MMDKEKIDLHLILKDIKHRREIGLSSRMEQVGISGTIHIQSFKVAMDLSIMKDFKKRKDIRYI
jgi:hypothetical protein